MHPTLPGPASGDSSNAPIQPSSRIQALDVLRGKALLGGLLVSIWVFGGFTTNWQKHLFLFPHGGNYILYAGVSLFLQGKMMAMMAMVFGASLVLLWRKQVSIHSPLAFSDFYIRRQLWLMVFGLLNGLLFLWSFDLLFHLGLMGILLFPFLRIKPKGLWVAAGLCLLFFCGKQYWTYADHQKTYSKYLAVTVIEKKIEKDSLARRAKDSTQIIQSGKPFVPKNYRGSDSANKTIKKDTLTKKQVEEKAAWEGLINSMKYDEKKEGEEKKEMRKKSFAQLYNHLLPTLQQREAEWTYTIGVWELGMMILLGMALLKIGFFEGKLQHSTYWWIAAAGMGMGLLLGYCRLQLYHTSLMDYEKYITHYWIPYNQFIPIERMLMPVGYAAAIIATMQTKAFSKLLAAVADVGRMTLTNYLVQSIFFTLFFTGFGMTNYGKLQQWQLYLLVVEVALVQTVFSVLWLRHYRVGPAEWLWRSAIAWKWQPLLKNKDADSHSASTNTPVSNTAH